MGAGPHYPALGVYIAFTTKPTEAPVWEDVTAYVYSIKIRRGRTNELDPPQMGTATVTLDNTDRRFDPTYTAGAYYGSGDLLPMRRLKIEATWAGTTYGIFYGYIRSWPQTWDNGIKPVVELEVVDGLYLIDQWELNTTYAQQLSSARVSAVLGDIGWTVGEAMVLDSTSNAVLDEVGGAYCRLAPTGTRFIEPGDTTVQASTLDKANALQHLHDVTATENGLMFVDKDGQFAFLNRHYRYEVTRITPQGVFDDASTGLHYSDYRLVYDDQEIFNDVRMTREGGTEQSTDNSASQLKYFKRTLCQERLLATTDTEMLARAQWYLNRYKEPLVRSDRLTIAGGDDDNMWPQIVGRDIGERIEVIRHPQGGTAITKDYLIQGMSHDIGQGWTWKTSYDLAPVDPSGAAWLLAGTTGDQYADYSILGTSTILAY